MDLRERLAATIDDRLATRPLFEVMIGQRGVPIIDRLRAARDVLSAMGTERYWEWRRLHLKLRRERLRRS